MSTLFTNGLLYRGEGRFEAGSLLIEGERILDVLGSAAPLPEADEVVDLAGGTLLPGFQDAHVHPLVAGLQLVAIDLVPAHDRDSYAEIIGRFAREHPEVPVLSGGGWFGDVFDGGFPTAVELDAVVPDRPVILMSHDGHGVWVNTAALRAAGIDASTPDPIDGRILRNGDEPSGVLLEGAAALLDGLRPEPDQDQLRAALLAAQHRLHSVGVTAWQDAAVGFDDIGPDPLPVYEAIDDEGSLTARVVLALWWDRDQGLEQIAGLERIRDSLRARELIDGGTIKVMLDGMVENRTATMLEPFCGHDDDRGLAFIPPEEVTALTIALDAADFQVHFHAVGDAAVRSALDAIEAARLHHGERSNRHHIAHLDVVDPSDTSRFGQLGVTANISALWARRDEEILTRKLPLLGPTREASHFPFAAIHSGGARIVGGSDWPVTDPNPLWAVRTAVTRTGVAEDPHAVGAEVLTIPLLSEQALPLGVALDSYLSAAAFINRLDMETGTLRVGAFADLVCIDADLRDVDAYGAATVRRTYVGGKVVYSAE